MFLSGIYGCTDQPASWLIDAKTQRRTSRAASMIQPPARAFISSIYHTYKLAHEYVPALTEKYVYPSADFVNGNAPHARATPPTVNVRPSKFEQPHPEMAWSVR
jgi:hypothetical protein